MVFVVYTKEGKMTIKTTLYATVFVLLAIHNAYSYNLRVGDSISIPLTQIKYTSPSFHFLIHDEIWYAALLPMYIPKTVYTLYENTRYSALKCKPFIDTENYTFDSDWNMISVNDNVYLMGTGTQYIDTQHTPTLATRSEMDIKFSDEPFDPTGKHWFFGVADHVTNSYYMINFGGGFNHEYKVYVWLCKALIDGGPAACKEQTLEITPELKTTKQHIILDAKNNLFQYGDLQISLQGRNSFENYSIYLFGLHNIKYATYEEALVYSRNNSMYIYSTKIYEDDVLVHHFVPVPCGLKVKDTVIPENGMYDIVEQRFYKNSGTGDFVYGID